MLGQVLNVFAARARLQRAPHTNGHPPRAIGVPNACAVGDLPCEEEGEEALAHEEDLDEFEDAYQVLYQSDCEDCALSLPSDVEAVAADCLGPLGHSNGVERNTKALTVAEDVAGKDTISVTEENEDDDGIAEDHIAAATY